MSTHLRKESWIILLLLGLLLAARASEAATGEESLAKINQLAPGERQAALVREAKKEGSIVWYAPMNREDLRQFSSAFEAEYPFLKIELLSGGPQSLLNRVLTEQRAGKHNFDMINIRSSAIYTLKKANAVMRYDTPYRKALRPGFYDKDGYINGIWASLLVYLFNAKQVSRAEAPKTIDDLLQPKWKGKMGIDQDADDWIAAILEYYGDEKGKQIVRNLAAQKLNIRKGRTLVSQLVAAGEFPLQIDAHHHEVVNLRRAGAPIDYVFPEPFVPVKAVSTLTLGRQAPHPHAAALLLDFMISRKGQEIAFRQRRWPAHRELATGGPDDVGSRKTLVPDAEKWGSRYEELVQLTALFGR
jgi:iron(III) transport system substrate-binding protein